MEVRGGSMVRARCVSVCVVGFALARAGWRSKVRAWRRVCAIWCSNLGSGSRMKVEWRCDAAVGRQVKWLRGYKLSEAMRLLEQGGEVVTW